MILLSVFAYPGPPASLPRKPLQAEIHRLQTQTLLEWRTKDDPFPP